jgi:hypothetical protein
MRKPRDRSGSRRVDVYPQMQTCPECQQHVKEKYHQQRWIIQLTQQVKVVSHFLRCYNAGCRWREAVYGPEQEGVLALPGYHFGLDVVARIGELRYQENLSISKMKNRLKTEGHLQISIKEVALLGEVFLALVTTVAGQDQEFMKELRSLGGIVLGIDGIQPEKSQETLYILREVRSGRVLVAKNLLSSATVAIEQLLEEVIGLGVPILGVISDKQESICLAIKHKLPTVSHQICQYHYVKDLAPPVCEADRHVRKELKKKIRGIREVERQAEKAASPEAQLVADYCLAMRTVMGDDGKYPLEPPGMQLYQSLQVMAASLERSLSWRPSALLQRLVRMLAVLTLLQKEYEQLVVLFSWIKQIAHLLKVETNGTQAQRELVTFVKRLKESCTRAKLKKFVAHVEKISCAFAPYLFADVQQPLLPRTNNELELFIGSMKKSRRHVTGRKNTQEFILREGSFVAMRFGLPQPHNWQAAFSSVNLDDFHVNLARLRQTDKRSKRWRVRRD